MPTLYRCSRCGVAMYPQDHHPPHVHVEFRDGSRCAVDIETFSVTGNIRPARKLIEALTWIRQNQAFLLTKWKEIIQ